MKISLIGISGILLGALASCSVEYQEPTRAAKKTNGKQSSNLEEKEKSSADPETISTSKAGSQAGTKGSSSTNTEGTEPSSSGEKSSSNNQAEEENKNDNESGEGNETNESSASNDENNTDPVVENTPPPPVVDPYKVEFVIPAEYDGQGPINTLATAVQLKVYPGDQKQELIITNNSARTFRLHTGGEPCPHAPRNGAIATGQSFTCIVSSEITAQANSQTYDHNAGNNTSLYITATAAPDPVSN